MTDITPITKTINPKIVCGLFTKKSFLSNNPVYIKAPITDNIINIIPSFAVVFFILAY